MLIVGLTGGIGTGKTTLGEALARRGAVVVDVDGLGRQVIGHGGSAVEEVIARFGERVRSDQGDIDRAALADIVFGDDQALGDLSAISHPAINTLIDTTVDKLPDDAIVVLDMAVLAESSLGYDNRHRYELVVVVEAPIDLRFQRLEQRGLTVEEAKARMDAQATDDERQALAHYLVTNAGSLDDLNSTAGEIWGELQRLHAEKLAV
ncbi:MAG: dephospho-CoA kinase [Actinomycetota bacterium]|nr:dephospho-CoA kinase [Actinomycetota bacterium]